MPLKKYLNNQLNNILFPLGGMGAGTVCLNGTGGLSSFSLRNKPDLANSPNVFSALFLKTKSDSVARVLEGPVPTVKTLNSPGFNAGNGLKGKNYGLPRFSECTFESEFPFASIHLNDDSLPVKATIRAWSPFIPGDADNSSLPVAALEYELTNTSAEPLEAVYYFCSANFMKLSGGESASAVKNGVVLSQPPLPDAPWEEGYFHAEIDQPSVYTDCAWFRGGWYDTLSMLWNDIEKGNFRNKKSESDGIPSPGATLSVPFQLSPNETKTITIRLCWYVPKTNLRYGIERGSCEKYNSPSHYAYGMCQDISLGTYVPWYAGRFKDIKDLAIYFKNNYISLRGASKTFSHCLFDMTLPPEVTEAVASNLSILKSPTILRQKDGRLWCWEGSHDTLGSCAGSCTHVWNYAQAIAHLFPSLERSLRKTEFSESQNEEGHQQFRTSLPIRPSSNNFHAAADGQLGGIMKLYRDWRISGDDSWISSLLPKAKQSLEYCIKIWDPDEHGVLTEPHHNTYDIEFWGADGMCTSFYLGALSAIARIQDHFGENSTRYKDLYQKGRHYLETVLFNGEYFIQIPQWEGLRTKFTTNGMNSENTKLAQSEGPKYQYGSGCLSDGVLGAWLAKQCGLGDILDPDKVKSHLLSVYRYNFKNDLSKHANPQRPGYAMGREGGLLLCTWPNGGRPTLPFIYSDEVWTGIEYQITSHLISFGFLEEGLSIVRTCRSRYTGEVRNPFDEYECGHWYGRALASYGLLEALGGARYDRVTKTLFLKPTVTGDFRCFLCTETGYGTVGVLNGEPFVTVISGTIDIQKIQ